MLRYSDVTPKELYLNRRRFIGAAAAAALAGRASAATPLAGFDTAGRLHNLLNDTAAPRSIVTSYNNFYEFGSGKDEPVKYAQSWTPNPEWPVNLSGEVARPKTLSLDQIMKLAPLEERIYRHRCVEGWSYVVPWIGFPLSALLNQVERTGKAKFVAFESFYDAKAMPKAKSSGIRFPYVEGLRLDEALHPLAFLAVGVYGQTLPNQNGAPIRLVVPWKYGFKGIKSIARVRFVEKQPPTTWNLEWPEAYAFYSNVNPNKAHPRFSQADEDRLDGTGAFGQGRKIKTTLFNGYGAEVSSLYAGMDLIRNY